jgi:DNA sulfur modification protein DndD
VIIREVELANFGTYAGINTIDLSPEDDRPLVLIGGSNGAGKTTLLESILLCLHGRRTIGSAATLRDYHELIRSRFHSPPGDAWRPSECSVGLRFEIAEGGVVRDFSITRRWRQTPSGSIREELELRQDGETVEDLPASAWQDFLDGLVPPGIASLFFFDGERIQALADDDSGRRLRDAVRRLLGLDLIEQLRLDLARFVSKKGDSELQAAERDAVECQQEVYAALSRIETLREERESLSTRRSDLAAEAARTRDVFARRGGVLALDRARLEQKHREARETAAACEAQVRELVGGLLPFALCPAIADRVARRIEGEAAAEEAFVVTERLAGAERKLRRRLKSTQDGDVLEVLRELLVGATPMPSERVHDLTSSERAVLADQLRKLRDDVPPTASKLSRQLRRAEEARTRTKELLDKAPDESDVSDLVVQVQHHERELAGLDHQISKLDDALQKAAYDHKVAERKRRLAAERVREADGAASRVSRALQVNSLLAEFEGRSQQAKLEEVEVEAARFFNRLSRKGSLLSRVAIDPDSFKVELRRWDDADLPRERLSAGEKQLLAISLLWALAKVSGRPLPVVIDTPLARLDRRHRDRLLTEYFPSVSHQVVVLSTDTEVDAAAAATLEPYVARAYQLVHDAEHCRTTISEGYGPDDGEVADAR